MGQPKEPPHLQDEDDGIVEHGVSKRSKLTIRVIPENKSISRVQTKDEEGDWKGRDTPIPDV